MVRGCERREGESIGCIARWLDAADDDVAYYGARDGGCGWARTHAGHRVTRGAVWCGSVARLRAVAAPSGGWCVRSVLVRPRRHSTTLVGAVTHPPSLPRENEEHPTQPVVRGAPVAPCSSRAGGVIVQIGALEAVPAPPVPPPAVVPSPLRLRLRPPNAAACTAPAPRTHRWQVGTAWSSVVPTWRHTHSYAALNACHICTRLRCTES